MPVQQAFGSPGGKSVLAPRIVKMIPKHSTYVEPFAGGAAVFFYKDPSPREVLNDNDPEIASAYKFIKGMTAEQFSRLSRFERTPKEGTFNRLKKLKPKGALERFYRFWYLSHFSWGISRGAFSKGEGYKERRLHPEKFKACRDRLRKVIIYNKDAEAIIRQFNSAATFFYLDPPYPGRHFKAEESTWTEAHLARMVKLLNRIKGKFLLSLGSEHAKLLPKSWNIKKVKVRRTPNMTGKTAGYEILAGNYKF